MHLSRTAWFAFYIFIKQINHLPERKRKYRRISWRKLNTCTANKKSEILGVLLFSYFLFLRSNSVPQFYGIFLGVPLVPFKEALCPLCSIKGEARACPYSTFNSHTAQKYCVNDQKGKSPVSPATDAHSEICTVKCASAFACMLILSMLVFFLTSVTSSPVSVAAFFSLNVQREIKMNETGREKKIGN